VTFTKAFGATTLLLAAGLTISPAPAQIPGKTGYRFVQENGQPLERLLSNSVIDLIPYGDDVLMGTGGGVSIWRAEDSTWVSADESHGLGQGSVSALGQRDGVIWAATAYTAQTSVGPLPAGGGVGFTADDGLTWTWFDQPVDPDTVTTYDPTTVNIQNVTYDLLITSTEVWITSWGGGLRKYSFADSAWHLVTPDTIPFSALDHLNHRAFSVAGNDSVLWVGTAAGINRSTDGGQTWVNYDHTTVDISGDFVTALGLQQWNGQNIVWAATWPAEGSDEFYGVSRKVGDGPWEVALTDSVQSLKAHNFAFDDSIVYAATNLGLYKSYRRANGAWTDWEVLPPITETDPATGQQFALHDPEVFSALVHQGILWVGTGDGLASSGDYGNTWDVHRAFVPTSRGGQPDTYAYPNPFSPRLSPHVVRFQYDLPAGGNVTVKVYDFAMDEVATVIANQPRGAGDNMEEWDGRRADGSPVATGVYYYVVERGGAGQAWGKFAVIY
jgi:hypothetical protein